MLLVEPLLDLSDATHLVITTDDLCSTFLYVTRSPENNLQGNNIVAMRLQTTLLSTFLSKLKVAETCSVFSQGSYLKMEIRSMFKNVNEVEPEAEGIMGSLEFLDESLEDAFIHVPPAERSYTYPSFKDISYPYLLVSITPKPKFIKVLSPGRAENLEQKKDELISLEELLGSEMMDFLDHFISLENKKRSASGTGLKDIEENKKNPVLKWLTSLGETIEQQVTKNDTKQVIVTDCLYGLNEAVMEVLSEVIPSAELWFVKYQGVVPSLATLLSSSHIGETSWLEDWLGGSAVLLKGQTCNKGLLGQHSLRDAGTKLCPCPLLNRSAPPPTQHMHQIQQIIEDNAMMIMAKVIHGTKANISKHYPNQDLSQLNMILEKVKQFNEYITENPRAYGKLSVHKISYISSSFGLKEVFNVIKEEETKESLGQLGDRLEALDKMKDEERAVELVRGCVAANLFDWGSSVLSDLLQDQRRPSFQAALNKPPERPWTLDQVDDWAKALTEKGFMKAVIFVDNAGVDFIMGIIPLARELLKRRSKVVICANMVDTLNDVTSRELPGWLNRVAEVCPIVRHALQFGMLTSVCSGQSKPSLDLRRVSRECSNACLGADLVVIQGMGRAGISNLYLSLTCPVLKMFNIKEKALSTLLGTPPLDGLCLYTPPLSHASL